MTDEDEFEEILRGVAAAPAVELSPELELDKGTRIGERYVVSKRVGAGGMGVVYRAHDADLDRDVAIKLHATRPSDLDIARLRREAQAMAQLEHPNVATVFDLGRHGEWLYVAMEFIDGGTARQWLAERSRHWREVRQLFVQAGRGLAAAHAVGLVHRDFKPDNVLLGPGKVKVADFGLALASGEAAAHTHEHSRSDSGSGRLTETGGVMGTPAYMAPEQLDGADVEASADQYSFCVALYEALTRRRPKIGAVLARSSSTRGEGPDIRIALPRSVPSALRRILERGLAEDPRLRYPTMDALVGDLEAVGRQRGRLLVVAGLAAAGAAAVALAWPTGLHCASDDPVADVWNSKREASIRDAFVATELSYASDATRSVVADVDAYVEAWADARRKACSLDDDPREFDLRIACLDRGLAGFRATLEVLEAGKPEVVAQASGAVADVGSVLRCLDAQQLASDFPVPDDPATAQSVRRIRLELAKWPALNLTGDYEAAAQHVDQTVADARATGHPQTLSQALNIRGTVMAKLARYAEAEADVTEAYEVARAARHDPSAREAATALIVLVLRNRDDLEASMDWGRAAQALIEVGPEAAPARSHLAHNLAEMYEAKGDLDAAIASYREALSHTSRTERPLDYAGISVNLADALDESSRPDEALQATDDAASLFIAELGPAHPSVAITLCRRAQILKSMLRFQAAETEAERCAAVFVGALGDSHPNVSIARNLIATIRIERGDPDSALPLFDRALTTLAKSLPPAHPEVAKVKANLAEACVLTGDDERAITLARQAVPVLEAAKDPFEAATRVSLGEALISAGRLDEGESQMNAAVRRGSELGTDGVWETADAYTGLAFIALERGEPAVAISAADNALEQIEGREESDGERAAALTAQGIAHLVAGNKTAARDALRRALELFEVAPKDRRRHQMAAATLARLRGETPPGITVSADADRLERWLASP